MSTDTGTDTDTGTYPDIDTATRARYVRLVYNRLGQPPTSRQVGNRSPHGSFYYRPEDGERWSDILREAGIPGYDDLVAEAIRKRWENRYPWQEFVTLRAMDLDDDLPLYVGHIGDILAEFERGDRDPELLDGLELSVVTQNSRWTRWEVSEA